VDNDWLSDEAIAAKTVIGRTIAVGAVRARCARSGGQRLGVVLRTREDYGPALQTRVVLLDCFEYLTDKRSSSKLAETPSGTHTKETSV
jgi:hypothetical protein